MIKNKLAIIAAGVVIAGAAATQALAGGWPIYIYSWENGDAWRSDYKMIYLRAHLAPGVPCKGTTVTFKYKDAQPGDNVSAGGDNGSFTFTEDSYKTVNGKQVPDCNTYAKYYSTNNVLKYGLVEFKTADGKVYNATYALNFQLSSPMNTDSEEKLPLPWEENRDEGVFTIKETPTTTIVESNGTFRSTSPAQRIPSDRIYPKTTRVPATTIVPKPYLKHTPATDAALLPIASTDSKLQQKVDDLQRKLEESRQRQSVLERELNQIKDWIKSIFTFFR